jgi:hypothetical protein
LLQGRCEVAADALNEGLKDGDPTAYYMVGLMYLKGYCVKADPARAPTYLEPAAKAAQRDAARTLVMMHGLGVGVPQSYAQAGVWFYAWGDIIKAHVSPSEAPASSAVNSPRQIGAEDAVTWGVIGTVAASVQDKLLYPRNKSVRTAAEVSMDLSVEFGPAGLQARANNTRADAADLRGITSYSTQPHEEAVRDAVDEVIKSLPPYPLPQRKVGIVVPYRFAIAR